MSLLIYVKHIARLNEYVDQMCKCILTIISKQVYLHKQFCPDLWDDNVLHNNVELNTTPDLSSDDRSLVLWSLFSNCFKIGVSC